MSDHTPIRPMATAQIMAVLVFALALFFLIAFATKSVEAYRLRNWRNRLQAEITRLERQREEMEEELRRRGSPAWIDEALRETGRVPEGVVSVLVVPESVPAQPTAFSEPITGAAPGAAPGATPESTSALFDNPNWRAWGRLIWGFDEEGDLYYNSGR